MASQFERDKHLVELFMQRQGWSPFEYHDPNTQARQTGADVLIVSGGRRIGIQVTEIDTGERRGRARAKERKEWRDSNLSTYCTSAQSDTNKLLEHFPIRLGVARVCEISFAFVFGNLFEKRGDCSPKLLNSARLHFA